MRLTQGSTTNLVVLVLGVALVVFFAGVSAAVAQTGSAPTEMWAAGAAISGALVGLLVEPPGKKAAAHRGATATITELSKGALQAAQDMADQKHGAEKDAAQQAVQRVQTLTETIQTPGFAHAAALDPAKAPAVAATHTVQALSALATVGTPGSAEADVYNSAVQEATRNKATATTAGTAAAAAADAGTLTGFVLVLLVVFVGLLAIGIGMSFIPSEGDQLIRQADKTVLALASAAGGALIGLLAPPAGSESTK